MAQTEKKAAKEKKAESKEAKKAEKVETQKAVEEKPKQPVKTEAKEKKAKETEKPSKTYVIPLKKLFMGSKARRARHASKAVKNFIHKHLKTEEVKMDPKLGEFLYSRGKSNIPRRVKVLASEEEGIVTVKLAETK